MEFNEKEIKRLLVIFFILALAVLAFLLVRPVILSIIAGLILAYIFYPLNKKILKLVREKNTAAGITSTLVLIIIIVPTWFAAPAVIRQMFNFFRLTQGIQISEIIRNIFPTASPEFISQVTLVFNNFTSKFTSYVLNSVINFFLNLPTLLLHVTILAFVFFFTLRDAKRLKEFVSDISPLNKFQERKIVQQFADITNSIVYGQVIIGFIQGIIAGIGMLIFGVPNALILTILSVILGVIPVIGPAFVWIPITLIFLINGEYIPAIGFFTYNLLITSTIDNLLRPYIVSRKSDLSPVIVLIGMIGGLFIFGILGLILGPLILAYFLTVIKAYRDKTLSSLFQD